MGNAGFLTRLHLHLFRIQQEKHAADPISQEKYTQWAQGVVYFLKIYMIVFFAICHPESQWATI